jgi:dipeptidyl aminopeptidase/acylaminoacyl peptidase
LVALRDFARYPDATRPIPLSACRMRSRSIAFRKLAPLLVLATLSACTAVSSRAPTHPSLVSAPLPEVVPAWGVLRADFEGRTRYRLSPDGTKLSWIAFENDYAALHVQAVEGGPVTIISLYRVPILNYAWTADNRHILIDRDEDGTENDHILIADIEHPANPVDATPTPGSKSIVYFVPTANPHIAYIASNERDRKDFDLFSVDLASGTKTLVATADGSQTRWLIDREGTLRGRFRKSWFAFRDAQTGAWHDSVRIDSGDSLVPVGDVDKNGIAWAFSNHQRDCLALVRFDLKSGREEAIYADPTVDVSDALIDHERQIPLVAISWPDRENLHVFDPTLAALLADLRGSEDNVLTVAATDDARNLLIVELVSADEGWTETHLVDRRDGTRRLLARKERDVWRDRISPTTAISFKAVDGLTLHGFLTLPKGAPTQHLPMVLLVHGGPWDRDRWGFSMETQFLANRGYAVLRVNYRGSVGYGRNLLAAGVGEFGKAMQQDLSDAVAWAVQQGIADPEKIAIMGGSYGGYAAMMGLVKTPKLFAAAVEFNGMSDLVAFSEALPPYWNRQIWDAFVGNPKRPLDRDRMTDVSPLTHVDRISRPLLALQNLNDVRVKHDQFDRFVAAMHAAGKTVEAVEFPAEGHSPRSATDVYTYFRDVERFLAKYLGGRTGP